MNNVIKVIYSHYKISSVRNINGYLKIDKFLFQINKFYIFTFKNLKSNKILVIKI